jgi:hypothetical protein
MRPVPRRGGRLTVSRPGDQGRDGDPRVEGNRHEHRVEGAATDSTRQSDYQSQLKSCLMCSLDLQI